MGQETFVAFDNDQHTKGVILGCGPDRNPKDVITWHKVFHKWCRLRSRGDFAESTVSKRKIELDREFRNKKYTIKTQNEDAVLNEIIAQIGATAAGGVLVLAEQGAKLGLQTAEEVKAEFDKFKAMRAAMKAKPDDNPTGGT